MYDKSPPEPLKKAKQNKKQKQKKQKQKQTNKQQNNNNKHTLTNTPPHKNLIYQQQYLMKALALCFLFVWYLHMVYYLHSCGLYKQMWMIHNCVNDWKQASSLRRSLAVLLLVFISNMDRAWNRCLGDSPYCAMMQCQEVISLVNNYEFTHVLLYYWAREQVAIKNEGRDSRYPALGSTSSI